MSQTPQAEDRLASINVEDFEAQVGQPFRFVLDPATVLVGKIDQVKRLGNRRQEAKRAPFSVEMTVEGQQYFHQRIVRFESEALGAFDIFAVPVGPSATGMRYELIFT
jgi:hypothetical protein